MLLVEVEDLPAVVLEQLVGGGQAAQALADRGQGGEILLARGPRLRRPATATGGKLKHFLK